MMRTALLRFRLTDKHHCLAGTFENAGLTVIDFSLRVIGFISRTAVFIGVFFLLRFWLLGKHAPNLFDVPLAAITFGQLCRWLLLGIGCVVLLELYILNVFPERKWGVAGLIILGLGCFLYGAPAWI